MKIRKIGTALSAAAAVILLVYFLRSHRETGVPSQDSKKKYNVIIIVSDALRADALGCYEGEASTPNLDRLAARGVLFENAFSTSPWTVPSAVGMFAGSYATSYDFSPAGRTARVLVPDNEFLFAEALKTLGYDAVMKIENFQASYHNNFQGFNPLPSVGDIKQSVPKEIRRKIRAITGRRYYRSSAYMNSFVVLRYLLDVPLDKNFILVYWILDPHEPYTPLNKFKSRIRVNKSKLSRNESFYTSPGDFDHTLSDAETRFVKDLYLAEVASVDERAGYVLKMLSKRHLEDNTYVIFTSDHGEQFGERGMYGHGGFGLDCNYYNVLVNVPLIIAGPGIKGGRRVKQNISLLGLMPALKELLGVKYKGSMQGESFVPLVLGRRGRDKLLYFDNIRTNNQIDAAVENNYKLISLRNNGFELYDLSADPDESNNIAGSNKHIIESMYSRIENMREWNRERQKANSSAVADSARITTPEKQRELLEKLKALGYVK